MLYRVVAGHTRSFAALVVGLAVWLGCLGTSWRPAGPNGSQAILAWDVAAAVFLLLAARLFGTRRPAQMADEAERQADGEWIIFTVILLGAVFSFVALTGELSGLKDAPPKEQTVRVGLAVATLLLSWSLTHVLFCFRYAHHWYDRRNDGTLKEGLDFPSDDQPDYWDFLYFAVVIGMTFQVSDVQIKSRRLRRLALLHGVLSFLFNTVIVALSVNIAAGLL